MPESCALIIDALIEERHKKGFTQKQIAELTGFSQSVIARIESKKTIPQLDTLIKVASALECKIEIAPI